MLIEKRITPECEEYQKFQQLYFSAFPEEERIPEKFLIGEEGKNDLVVCYDGDCFCGFYSTLTVKDITHILFLAVEEAFRDHGYGSQFLTMIEQRYPGKRIIVDIEADDPKAENESQRIRRRAFYERHGYVESEISYIWQTVPYVILIKNGEITQKEFTDFWEYVERCRRKTWGKA